MVSTATRTHTRPSDVPSHRLDPVIQREPQKSLAGRLEQVGAEWTERFLSKDSREFVSRSRQPMGE